MSRGLSFASPFPSSVCWDLAEQPVAAGIRLTRMGAGTSGSWRGRGGLLVMQTLGSHRGEDGRVMVASRNLAHGAPSLFAGELPRPRAPAGLSPEPFSHHASY